MSLRRGVKEEEKKETQKGTKEYIYFFEKKIYSRFKPNKEVSSGSTLLWMRLWDKIEFDLF